MTGSPGMRGVVTAVVRKSSSGDMEDAILQDDKKITLPDGSRFRGRVMNALPLSGVVMHANGARYKGTFLQGKEAGMDDYWFRRHGTGTLTFKNGDEYEGTFVDGDIVGEGRFTVAADRTVYSGFFGLPTDGGADGASEGDIETGGVQPGPEPRPPPVRSGPGGLEYRGVESAAGFRPVPASEAELPPSPPLLYENEWLLTGEGEVTWPPTMPQRHGVSAPEGVQPGGAAGLGGRTFQGSFHRGVPVGDRGTLQIDFSHAALEAADAIDEAFGRAARGGFGVSFVGGLAGLGEATYEGPLSPRGHPHGRGEVVWAGGHAVMEFVEGVPHGETNEVHGGASHRGDGTLHDGPSQFIEGRVPPSRLHSTRDTPLSRSLALCPIQVRWPDGAWHAARPRLGHARGRRPLRGRL